MPPSGNIIVLKGDRAEQRREGKAGAAGILPGHLLIRSTTVSGDVLVNPTALDDLAPKLFAVENDVVGNTAADAYADNDQVQYLAAQPGNELLGRAAAAQTWARGDALESAGGGQLQSHTSGATPALTGRIIAYAIEPITTPAADTLVEVEVA